MNSSTTDQLQAEQPTIRNVPGPLVGFDCQAMHDPTIAVTDDDNESLPLSFGARRAERPHVARTREADHFIETRT